jgi:hypothetical protein
MTKGAYAHGALVAVRSDAGSGRHAVITPDLVATEKAHTP